jgi:LPS export ABC transporter protein LptC
MRMVCVLVWGAVLTFPGCEEKIKPAVLPAVDSRLMPSQESWKSDIIISDSGRVKALINAGYLRTYDDKRTTLLTEGVVVYFFDEQGRQTSVLTSEEGKVDEYTNNLEAQRNVVVTSNDQTTLKTQRLFWDNRRALIHTPEFVQIATPKERLQGHGFESEQNLKNYRIFRATGQAKTD